MTLSADWAARARAWLKQDPDPTTRAELEALVAAGDEDAVRRCFEPPLAFGTAGLRGAVGPGPAQMNRAIVRKVAWALGRFLQSEGLADRPVVVGFDARPSSGAFARDTVEVLTAQGLSVQFFPEPSPTPWVAFACRALGAAAGVVVTASHNPAGDNGYKVYDDQGIQIVAPWDARIAEAMAEAPPADRIELRAGGAVVSQEIVDAYFSGLGAPAASESSLRVAYTPLHGVGLASIERALRGRAELLVVAEQAEPDGTFPTVAFPNPEEPGAVDALLELAAREGCDLALANDPDADRLAVGVCEGGRWRRLSGDEVGILLADHLLGERAGAGQPVVSSSIVSSPMLDAVARAHGARVERTLTGFKWLCRVPATLRPDERFVFGYEEALGYSADPRVLDKDGISAAVRMVELAAALRRQGSDVVQRLHALYAEHGLWVSCPTSVRVHGNDAQERMTAALARLRRSAPSSLAGLELTSRLDYLVGAAERAPHLGTQDLLQFELVGGAGSVASAGRVLVRPSGTEPKVKLYVHLRAELSAGVESLGTEGLRAAIDQRREALAALGGRVAGELCAAAGLA